MFYLSYLRSELVRRKSRTILTASGLAIGVALVIVISSLTRGLDNAQQNALNPLSSIGTDLTVTLAPAGDARAPARARAPLRNPARPAAPSAAAAASEAAAGSTQRAS